MRGSYPGELRVRVIEFVEAGGSRRDAAEHFQVGASSAVRWLQRFRKDGTSEPMPRGGGASPLEKYSRQILDLIGEQRDLTLNELVSMPRKQRISASSSALSRFFARHGITLKKKPAGGGAQARRRWIREQGWLIPPGSYLSTRQQSPQYGAPERLEPPRRTPGRGRVHGAMGDGNVHRWPASNPSSTVRAGSREISH
jgi:transposase